MEYFLPSLNMTVAEIIKASKTSSFQFYREGNFYYNTDAGYEFVIPLEDISGATLNAEEKTIFFMRWIRKQLETTKDQ